MCPWLEETTTDVRVVMLMARQIWRGSGGAETFPNPLGEVTALDHESDVRKLIQGAKKYSPPSKSAKGFAQPQQILVALEPIEQVSLGGIDTGYIGEEPRMACLNGAWREAIDAALEQRDSV